MTGAHTRQITNRTSLRPKANKFGHTLGSEESTSIFKEVSCVINTSVLKNIVSTASNASVAHKISFVPKMAAVPTSGTPQVSLPMQQSVQLITVRPNQANVMPTQQVRSLAPRMILSPQVIQNAVRTASPGVIPGAAGGHLIVKTENGQMHLVRVSAGQAPTSGAVGTANAMPVTSTHITSLNQQQQQMTVATSNNAISTAGFMSIASSTISAPTNTLTNNTNCLTNNTHLTNSNIPASPSPPSVISNGVANTIVSTTGAPPVVLTVHQSNNTLHTSTASTAIGPSPVPPNAAQQITANQTITAEDAKNRCKNFLATLLKLANEQKQPVAKNVRNLIQGLIDSKLEPEAFTEELQKDLNSSPQPCLVPFLKRTLPYLRLSLARGDITIDGVEPPSLNANTPIPGATTIIPTATTVLRPLLQQPQQQIRLPINSKPPVVNSVVRVPNTIVVQQSAPQQLQQSLVSTSTVVSTAPILNNSTVVAPPQSQQQPANAQQQKPNTTILLAKFSSKEKPKEKQNFAYSSFSSSSVADDDINDVAAMGGVNLGEESQKILDSTGFVGAQIRSCKDETFLLTQPLQQRLKLICAKHDIDEPGKEFIALLSHAVQEKLKTYLEKLSVAAEHRLDIIKNEPRYELFQDVKGQLRFLEDLDRLEKKRKDEFEREILLRAAKSRNKNEDPDQAKLKAKAKELQRVEMEEMRQRDANMAALKALQGPRKRPKLDTQPTEEMPIRQRTKRVNLRDATFIMEQEKDHNKSTLLYKTYLK